MQSNENVIDLTREATPEREVPRRESPDVVFVSETKAGPSGRREVVCVNLVNEEEKEPQRGEGAAADAPQGTGAAEPPRAEEEEAEPVQKTGEETERSNQGERGRAPGRGRSGRMSIVIPPWAIGGPQGPRQLYSFPANPNQAQRTSSQSSLPQFIYRGSEQAEPPSGVDPPRGEGGAAINPPREEEEEEEANARRIPWELIRNPPSVQKALLLSLSRESDRPRGEGGAAAEPPGADGGAAAEPPMGEGGAAAEPPMGEGGAAIDPPREEGGDEDADSRGNGMQAAPPAVKSAQYESRPIPVNFSFSLADQRHIIAFIEKAKAYEDLRIERGEGRIEVLLDPFARTIRSKVPGNSEHELDRASRNPHKFFQDHPDIIGKMIDISSESLHTLLKYIKRAGIEDIEKYYVYMSVAVISPKAKRQPNHRDKAKSGKNYITCFVKVTHHRGQGDTMFHDPEQDKFVEIPGDAKMWDGNVLHYGAANESKKDRIALSLVLSKDPDTNRDSETRQAVQYPEPSK